ncbi:MAG TPA: Gfo/Idh/MocA family oxidoreductase [Bryobacteraceae bacterium]|nr:Gfo/Idh/MocA family oxidoreductase [Bryobacteraceae bacterium]
MKMNRRQAIRSVALSGLAVQGETGRAAAPNDRIGVALIGCGNMGRNDVQDFQKSPEVEVVALCDVDQERLHALASVVEPRARLYGDYRRVLDDRAVNVVIIATPDHWHPLITVDACHAGKDVYVEKPVSNRVREGRAMVNAARTNQRVVQVGLQQRSGSHFQRAAKVIQAGELGDIRYVQCWIHERQGKAGVGTPPDSVPPATLDWDFWLGPAQTVPYNKQYHPGNWRNFFNFGGGRICDWGVHLVDFVHFAMGQDQPLSVASSGGKFYVTDRRDTPDTQEAMWEYPGFLVHYTHLLHNSYGNNGNLGAKPFGSYGIQFHGTRGTLFIDRNGYDISPEMQQHSEPGGIGSRSAFDDLAGVSIYYTIDGPAGRGTTSEQHLPHVSDFLRCVKTREKPIADIEAGHRSTTACHLGNVAYRLGRKLKWNAPAEEVVGDDEANRLLTRAYRSPWKLPGLDG